MQDVFAIVFFLLVTATGLGIGRLLAYFFTR